MKAIVIHGSRNHSGQTARAAEGCAAGLRSAGVEVEKVFLPELSIERCRQCEDNGWGICRSEGRCIIEDDFAGVVDRIRAADRVVFANPVYFGDLSESLRAFLDRLRRMCRTTDAAKQGIAGKLAVGICVAGGGGGGAPSSIVSLEKVLTTCGFYLADMIPVRRQNLDHKVAVLERTGAWLAGYSPAD